MELKFFDIHDELDFGKYHDTGKTVGEILESDKTYIRWCIENMNNINFSDEVYSILER